MVIRIVSIIEALWLAVLAIITINQMRLDIRTETDKTNRMVDIFIAILFAVWAAWRIYYVWTYI